MGKKINKKNQSQHNLEFCFKDVSKYCKIIKRLFVFNMKIFEFLRWKKHM